MTESKKTNALLKTLGAVLTVCSLAAAAGCADSGASGDSKTIRVVQFPGILQGFYPYLADELGNFADEGYEIEYVNVDNGPALISALVGGSVDIAFVGTQLAWPVLEKDQDLVMLAGTDKYVYQIVTCGDTPTPNANAPFPENITDIRGKKVGVIGPGTQVEQFVQRLGEAAGMTPGEDFQTVSVGGPATMIPACEEGQVDFITPPPPAEFLLEDDFTVVASAFEPETTGNMFEGYLSDMWATTGSYLESNRSQVTDFCQILAETKEYASLEENYEEVGKLLAEYISIPEDTAVEVWRNYVDTQLIPIDEETWEIQEDWRTAGRDGAEPLGYEEYVDSECTNALS